MDKPSRNALFIFALALGLCAQANGQDVLEQHRRKAESREGTVQERISATQAYLALLLDSDTRGARDSMPVRYSVLDKETPDTLVLSPNWSWARDASVPGGIAHTSSDGSPHKASGVSRYVIPPAAVLEQHVRLDPEQAPQQISLAFTVPLFRYAGFENRTCRVRWGGRPIEVETDNSPFDFYAGPLPEKGKWVTLEVPAIRVGLAGRRPLFLDLTFDARGGKALWGPTMFRRGEIELFPAASLGVFKPGEPVQLTARLHNHTRQAEKYDLSLTLFDFAENRVHERKQPISVGPLQTQEITLTVPEEALGSASAGARARGAYFAAYATRSGRDGSFAARTAFGIVTPNRTGLQAESPFGMMIWDRPSAQESVGLYRDAGTKFFSTTIPSKLASLYARNDMFLHGHIWRLAYPSRAGALAAKPGENPLIPSLADTVRSLQGVNGRFFSNFWEVDLRVLPKTYGANARFYYEAAKKGNPDAVIGSGGIASLNTGYTDIMMGSGGKGYIDFAVYMGYITPNPPEPSGLVDELRALKEIFRKHGAPDSEVWLGEWNFFDHVNVERPEFGPDWIQSNVSRDLISAYLVREALTALGAGADRILPNALFQPAMQPLAYRYGHIMTGCASHRYDNTPLPMFFAWSVLTRHLEGKQVKEWIDVGPGVYAVRFDAHNEAWKKLGSAPTVVALWTGYGVRNVGLRAGEGNVTVMDLTGGSKVVRTVNGVLSLAASPEPQYVLLRGAGGPAESADALLTIEEEAAEAVFGEAADVDLTLHARNPSDTAWSGRLVLAAPNWCRVEPAEVPLDIEPQGNTTTRVTVHVPADNRDRIHYEFADLVPRGEHRLIFALQDSEGHCRARAGAALRVREPIEVSLEPQIAKAGEQDKPGVVVRIRNNSGQAKEGTVELRTKAKLQFDRTTGRFNVGPGSETVVPFRVQAKQKDGYYFSFGVGEGHIVEAVVRCTDGAESRQSRGLSFFAGTRAKQDMAIDGKPDDWADAAWFDVGPDSRASGIPFFAGVHSHNQENTAAYFSGASDLSARWAAKWDDANLYLFFRVTDNAFDQAHTGERVWNGDSVVFALNPTPAGLDAGIQPAPCEPGSIHTLMAALTPDGPQVFRRFAAAGLPAGLVTRVQAQILKLGDGSAYEIAIPWEELGRETPQAGDWIQTSIVFNDSDGHGRKTWINWFGGLTGVSLEPRRMGDISLVE